MAAGAPVIANSALAGATRATERLNPRQRRAIILSIPSLVGKGFHEDLVFNRIAILAPPGIVGSLFGGNTLGQTATRHEIFVARHVGPFGPNAGSMRKLSLAVIAPRGKASSGMTRVA
jgi:hypothetical protein